MTHTIEQQQVLFRMLTDVRKTLGKVVDQKVNESSLLPVYSRLEDIIFAFNSCDSERNKRFSATIDGIRKKVLLVETREKGPSYLTGSLHLLDDMAILIGIQSGMLLLP